MIQKKTSVCSIIALKVSTDAMILVVTTRSDDKSTTMNFITKKTSKIFCVKRIYPCFRLHWAALLPR